MKTIKMKVVDVPSSIVKFHETENGRHKTIYADASDLLEYNKKGRDMNKNNKNIDCKKGSLVLIVNNEEELNLKVLDDMINNCE